MSRSEVGVVEHRLQERNVGGHTANAELRQGTSCTPHRRVEVATAAGQLDQHRVEMAADLSAEDRTAVESDAGTPRRAVGGDTPDVRPETIRRILGGDTAL